MKEHEGTFFKKSPRIHFSLNLKRSIQERAELKRCTGEEGILEELTFSEMKALRLEGTAEQIPAFDEVLELFEGKTPLIIELKTWKDNHRALSEAVCRRLDQHYW